MNPIHEPLPSDDPSPKYEEFNNWYKWTTALAEWVYRQADKGDMSAGRLTCVFDLVEFQTKRLADAGREPAKSQDAPRLMVSKYGEIHVECPDCRGECKPYIAAHASATPDYQPK